MMVNAAVLHRCMVLRHCLLLTSKCSVGWCACAVLISVTVILSPGVATVASSSALRRTSVADIMDSAYSAIYGRSTCWACSGRGYLRTYQSRSISTRLVLRIRVWCWCMVVLYRLIRGGRRKSTRSGCVFRRWRSRAGKRWLSRGQTFSAWKSSLRLMLVFRPTLWTGSANQLHTRCYDMYALR